MTQTCPICGREVQASARYPTYVCSPCVAKASDAHGELVDFHQGWPGGAFTARYRATGAVYPSDACFIDGVKCRGREARFGGIVIEPERR